MSLTVKESRKQFESAVKEVVNAGAAQLFQKYPGLQTLEIGWAKPEPWEEPNAFVALNGIGAIEDYFGGTFRVGVEDLPKRINNVVNEQIGDLEDEIGVNEDDEEYKQLAASFTLAKSALTLATEDFANDLKTFVNALPDAELIFLHDNGYEEKYRPSMECVQLEFNRNQFLKAQTA